MDRRIIVNERPGRLIFPLDGSTWPFTPSNSESKAAARQRLIEHAQKCIAAIEQHAGKTLTTKELYGGIVPIEDRDVATQIADRSAETLEQQRKHFDPRSENPFRKGLEMGLGERRRQETPREALERQAAEWDEKHANKQAAEAFAADPRRQRAVALAEKELLSLRYDPAATVSQTREADAMLSLAKSGNLDDFRAARQSWNAAKKARLDLELSKFDDQAAELRQQRDALSQDDFELPEAPPAPEPPKAKPIEVIQMVTSEFDKLR